jgi:quercetin dioxygenase-like cupin family protein
MRAWLVSFAVAASSVAWSQDSLKTDPGKYTLVQENERVRVLRYHDQPGDKTSMHAHPDFVLYALAPFKRRLTFPDGKTMVREFKAGDVVLMSAQKHIGENVGTTDTEVLLVELKEPSKK